MIKDLQQRQECLNPHKSFIVEAGAGAGKTEQLTQCVLSKLAVCDHPEEIYPLTFTQKAAREMRDRIMLSLQRAATTPPPQEPHQLTNWKLARAVLERDRELGWDLLKNPSRLRVMTIDSLCAMIVRQLPITGGGVGTARVTDDAAALYHQAALELLRSVNEEVPWRQSLLRLCRHVHNDSEKLIQLLSDLLAVRDQWEPIVFGVQDSKQLLDSCLCVLGDMANRACAELDQQLGGMQPLVDQLWQFSAANRAIAPSNLSRVDAYKDRAAMLLTAAGQLRATVTEAQGFPAPSKARTREEKELYKEMKDRFAGLREQLSNQEGVLNALLDIQQLPPQQYDADLWEVMEAILEVLPVLSGLLKMVMQEQGYCDFIEISQAAAGAFKNEVSEVALKLDYRIRHILVDEFQDTNMCHFRLLEAIVSNWQPGDGRTISFFGDPKQCIYRFREADVGLFIRVKNHGIGAIRPTLIRLTSNFRSEEPVVSWNNRIFATLFPSQDNAAVGAIAFHPSDAVHPARYAGQPINLVALVKASIEQEMAYMASQVRTLRAQEPHDSIVVLVRTRSLIPLAVAALKAAGVPVQAADLASALARSYMRELVALAVALTNPHDREMWAVLLTSAFIGLSLQDLKELYAQGGSRTPLEMLLNPKTATALSPAGANRLARAASVIQHFYLNRYRKSDADLIEGVWRALDGPACYPGETNIESNAANLFKALTELAEAGKTPDRECLTRKLELLVESERSDTDNAVEVMTIHKSKGLEFDHVFMPGLSRSPRRSDRPLLLWYRKGQDPAFDPVLVAPFKPDPDSPNMIYKYLMRIERRQVQLEEARILYVGCTRAIRSLTLTATVTEQDGCLLAPDRDSLLYPLLPIFQVEAQRIQPAPVEPDAQAQRAGLIVTDDYVSHWLQAAGSHELLTPASVPLQPVSSGSPLSAVEGTMVHRLLELAARRFGRAIFADEFLKDQAFLLEMLCRDHGVSRADRPALLARIHQHLAGMQGHARLQDYLFAERFLRYSEHEVFWVSNGHVQKGIIDLYLEDEQMAHIIDYKFIFPEPQESLEAFKQRLIERYAPKMGCYLSAIRRDTRKPVRAALYNPVLDLEVEVDLDGQGRRQAA